MGRPGDFDALVAVLDPDVVFRIDRGMLPAAAREPAVVRGAAEVAQYALARGAQFAQLARPAIVNGAAGLVLARGPRPFAVAGFTIEEGRIVELDLIADPQKLRALSDVRPERDSRRAERVPGRGTNGYWIPVSRWKSTRATGSLGTLTRRGVSPTPTRRCGVVTVYTPRGSRTS